MTAWQMLIDLQGLLVIVIDFCFLAKVKYNYMKHMQTLK